MTVKLNFKLKPFDHQVDALDYGWSKPEFGLFMEMGTGKSKVLIDNMAMLYLDGQINFALVIAPKGVYRNWVAKEIPEHMSDDIPHRVIRWVSGPQQKTKRRDALGPRYVQGTDNLRNECRGILHNQGPEGRAVDGSDAGSHGMIAVDESTTIKNHKAKRTKVPDEDSRWLQVQEAVDWISHNQKPNGYLFAVRVPPPWALGF